MAKRIFVFALCLMVLVSGCSKQAEVSDPEGVPQQTAAVISATPDTQQGSDIGSYTGNISDLEYAFILWSFRDQVVSDLTYTLYDADGDGANELLINAITDEDNGMHTQFLADSNDTQYHFWGYTPTGAAESSSYCNMEGYDTILWNRDFSTLDYVESHYNQWTGRDWEEIAALDGVSFDYKNAAAFDCPNVLNIEMAGEPEAIFSAIDAYFEKRAGAFHAGEADLDDDGNTENVYYVLSAADDWYESLRMENTTETQSFLDHRDIYMTVVIADKTENGAVLRPVRVKYRGNDVALNDNTLYINNEEYIYTDTQSTYSSSCLQTALKSPGTYGDFDSQGNRTILSMVKMPFYDINKMCTDTTLYENDPKMAAAMLGDSRCTFEFMTVSDSGSLTNAAPAYMVEVASWNLVTDGMTIDPLPIIGDFHMGDPIAQLRAIMVPSTEWKPLLCGQDFLANTNFYYRPSCENEDVYFVQVWTDGESENSKVCAIRFEYALDLDSAAKEALGLQ